MNVPISMSVFTTPRVISSLHVHFYMCTFTLTLTFAFTFTFTIINSSSAGVHSIQGTRNHMEDTYQAALNIDNNPKHAFYA